MPKYHPLMLNSRELGLQKAVIAPELGGRTVLTNEPWEYVDLYLVRQKRDDARFYWQQAKEFFSVAQGLPLQSAPLLLYYAFMNATKALLSSKGIKFVPFHGVAEWVPSSGGKAKAFSVGVKIKNNGVLPSLSSYYGEKETNTLHLLKDIFLNLPYIHRTYCLTYTSQQEMFIPIINPRFVVEEGTTKVCLEAQLSSHYVHRQVAKRLPPSLTVVPNSAGSLRSTSNVTVSSATHPSTTDIAELRSFSKSLRDDLSYINGTQTLWYIRTKGTRRLQRQSTTLTLAAMHRLSEVCRYAPMQLAKHLEGQHNWLLSEFIRMSGGQFIDEISSEITGKQFLAPNVRPAS